MRFYTQQHQLYCGIDLHAQEEIPFVLGHALYMKAIHGAKESAGKRVGKSGRKIGNVHLKWAFSEAAVLFLRANPAAQSLYQRLQARYGKPKALSILAHKLGRTVYFLLRREQTFERRRFFAA